MTGPIVILHGWGLSASKFEQLKKEFEYKHFEVFAIDFPGFGNEPTPEKAYSVSEYATFLYSKLQSLGIKKPILIGHSFGGRVSLRFNTIYPNFCRKIILTGTPGYNPTSIIKRVVYMFISKIGKLLFTFPLITQYKEKFQLSLYKKAGVKEYLKGNPIMKETFKRVVQESLVLDMKLLNIPCLLVWGEHDSIVPLTIAYKMKKTIPMSKLVILQSSDHGVPYKKPQEFVNAVEEFIRV